MGNKNFTKEVVSRDSNFPKHSRTKRALIYAIPTGLVILCVLFILFVWQTHSAVESICAEACQEYPGEKVAALIVYISSDAHSLQKKNRAIWALGHIGNERALPTLEKLHTGKPCDHDKFVCQHELRKAIKKIKGETLNLYFWK